MDTLKIKTNPIWDSLQIVLSEQFCIVPPPDEMDTSFMELGANSLMLMELSRGIEKVFGIRIHLRQFFEEITTVHDLYSFLEDNISDDWCPITKKPQNQLVENTMDFIDPIEFLALDNRAIDHKKSTLPYLDQLMNYQIQATTQGITRIVEKQLAFLQQIKGIELVNVNDKASHNSKELVAINSEEVTQYQKSVEIKKNEILWGLPEIDKRKLNSDQQLFIQKLQHTFSKKTKKSKTIALESRKYFANNRPSLGFRLETKEMFYPIVSSHSDGPYLYDIDGNEYIDLALGFGVHMFGHKPKFIFDELKEQIEKGIQIGPQSELTAMVAKQFCEITGNERVTFYNSGTEAVMTAIRVARAATGKNKILMFSGAYHGHSDTTLMVSGENKGGQTIQPMCIGIPNVYTHDVVVLPYDNENALETIGGLKDELAAVLVEPVQSRQPNLQPVSFLKKLRKFTNDLNIVLIFDEMITGFRIKPGGAQVYFGIKSDLSTYGKVIGGGMPIGCVAGRADLMSYIDGGFWGYGDGSYPKVQKVYTGGTFCNHPLTMRSALAVLNRLKIEGESLQDGLSKTTDDFGSEINIFFKSENIPIRMVNFGSLFRFVMSENFSYVYQPLEMDLFHSLLISKGVFTWEGRTCYFSTAHTKEVIDKLIEIIKSSVIEMKAGGFFLKNVKKGEVTAPKCIKAGLQIPLTESQKQLWILYQANKTAFDAYTYAIGFKIKGHVEMEVLNKAIQALAANHEALRTSIDANGEFQTILPHVDVSFTEVDFTLFGYNQQNAEIHKWFLDQYTQGFNIENAPLFKTYLLRLKKKENLLVIFSHHIVVDGISEQVMLRDIIKFYNTIQSGQSLIQEKTMQLSKYVQAIHNPAHQDLIKAKKGYWDNKMNELSLSLNLPADRVHPPKPSFRGIRKKVLVDHELIDFIKDYSKKNGCSNFMTWLIYYMLWLHKISAQDQLVVFTTSSGRYFDNTLNMVGYCANPIIVKSNLSHNPIFEDYMKEVKTELLNVYEHQEYPFSELIREFGETLKLENRLPFTALFNMDHIHLDKMGDAELELYFLPIRSTIADLNLNVTETDDAFILCFDFNTDIFEENSINRLIETFISMVKNSLSDSGAMVSEIVLLEETNLNLVTKTWNETSFHYGRYNYLHEFFEVQARVNPQRIAVVAGSQSLTYDELNRKSNQMGHFIIKHNIGPNQPVGLLLNNSVELIIGILGVLKSGNAYVPIDPKYPNERVTNIIEGSSIVLAVTSEELLGKLPKGIKSIALNRDSTQIQRESVDNLHVEIKPDYLCYVINTSGSTGLPKSVGLSHKNITNMINWFLSTNQIRAEDKVFLFTSICFDLTQKNIYTALSAGAQLHISLFTVYDPYRIRDYIENEKITWITCTPSVIAPMIENNSDDQLKKLESIRFVYLGGEVARKSIFKNWIENRWFNAIVVNTYGPTECSDVVTVYPISKADLHRESEFSIGKPIPNLKIYILDKYQKPLPIGIKGEICIAGKGVSIGYLNDSEKQLEKFIPNPFCSVEDPIIYKTGDLGRFRSDGNIEIIGRNDNQVKIRGFRIELEEIETVLIKHIMISNVAVCAKKINESEVKLVAYISFKKDVTKMEAVSYKSLRDFVKISLPEYMVPEQFIVIDSFILTSNGKIDRKNLIKQDGKILENDENAYPENAIEERIVEMCKNLLGIKKIGTNANFFESGGHSLKAVQLSSLLLNEFNVQLGLKDLFNAGTIKKIASLIIGDDATTDDYVALAQEAILDDDIEPFPGRPKNPPVAILLTGATGFIGRFLLRRLLDDYDQIKIYCLVRASNQQHAAARLKDTLSQWDLWRSGDEDRIEAIPGDISLPGLGLNFDDYHFLSETVDSIFHCAASVNHFENYATAKAANVDCVNDLLRLANTKRPKLLNFISTLSVFNSQGHPEGRVIDEASVISAENHLAANGYETSKWVAETIVSLAQARAIRCNIYRLGLVWADSEKGRFDAQQREYRVLESCVLTGCGIIDYAFDMQPVPVDYVVNAISLLAKQNPQGGQIFHIGGTEGSVINICACLDDLPILSLKRLSWFNWIKEVQALHNQGHTLPVVPFVGFGFSMNEKQFEEHQVNAAQNRSLFDWKKTREELELSGLDTPVFDRKMIKLTLEHIRQPSLKCKR